MYNECISIDLKDQKLGWKNKYPQWVTKNGKVKAQAPLEVRQEVFIEKSNNVHGDKYDYSKSIYTGSLEKLTITCPLHGDFKQSPNAHLQGQGCSICRGLGRPKNTEKFLQEAINTHGYKYDYTKSVYVGALKKLIIECPEHGDFEQAPSSHLMGRGCPSCAGNRLKTTPQFIAEAINTHGNKYLYEKVEYINSTTKVIITCPDHGDFKQEPPSHIRGRGCPRCTNKVESKIVYIFTEFNNNYKIGITYNIVTRKKELERGCGFELLLVAYKEFPNEQEARDLERKIHALEYENPYSEAAFDGYTEWRTINQHDLEILIASNGFTVAP